MLIKDVLDTEKFKGALCEINDSISSIEDYKFIGIPSDEAIYLKARSDKILLKLKQSQSELYSLCNEIREWFDD